MIIKSDAAVVYCYRTNGRALDVGCSVGGGTFELATTFDEAVGFDFSQAFVDAANGTFISRFISGNRGEKIEQYITINFALNTIPRTRM